MSDDTVWIVTGSCGDYYCEGSHVLGVAFDSDTAARIAREAEHATTTYLRVDGRVDSYQQWEDVETSIVQVGVLHGQSQTIDQRSARVDVQA